MMTLPAAGGVLATRPADRLPGEPGGRGAEHYLPAASPEDAQPRHEHSGHRHAHEDMDSVDLVIGRPVLLPGDQQAAHAIGRGNDHYARERIREPGRSR